MNAPPTILETERLRLRRLVDSDLDDLVALYRDPEVRRYFPEGTLTREQTREELEWFREGHPLHPELGLWATILKDGDRFVGRCGLLPWTLDGQYEVEIAYMLAREYWERGLATEAARGLMRYAVDSLGLRRLICLIDRDNLASIRVAMRLGMRFEKTVDDGKGPAQLYAIEAG
jgi:ribosomal-protein-alanine N-acetyltransferase